MNEQALQVHQVRNVRLAAGEEIFHTQDVVPIGEQSLAQMRAKEAGSSGSENFFHILLLNQLTTRNARTHATSRTSPVRLSHASNYRRPQARKACMIFREREWSLKADCNAEPNASGANCHLKMRGNVASPLILDRESYSRLRNA
jgi:hypothetical protein